MNAQALATAEPRTGEVVQTDAGSLMAVITRIASDPNFDAEKMDRMLGAYERITARQAETVFNEAMTAAQEELRPIAADASNKQTQSKYASYPALDKAVRPIYTKHGFALSFNTADGAAPEYVRVVCRVSHKDGHKETYHVDMPADGKGAKGGDVMTKTHAVGAAVSYGQRYLLKMIFNIAVGDDDDGNGNGGRDLTGAGSAAIASLNAVAGSREALRQWNQANAEMIEALPTDEQNLVIKTFNARWAKAK